MEISVVMRELKRMIIEYLMDEYDLFDATEQVCFAEIEKVELVKITYSNGQIEYLEQKEDEVIKVKIEPV